MFLIYTPFFSYIELNIQFLIMLHKYTMWRFELIVPYLDEIIHGMKAKEMVEVKQVSFKSRGSQAEMHLFPTLETGCRFPYDYISLLLARICLLLRDSQNVLIFTSNTLQINIGEIRGYHLSKNMRPRRRALI